MAKRSGVLEYAVLGLLQDAPMHGYELRKRLNSVLGSFRAISYGSLYPCLKGLLAQGLIAEDGTADAGAPALSGRRSKVVYKITAEGKERFTELLADSGPQAFDDDGFGVHLAFFSRTPAEIRMRILEDRRRAVEERREGLRAVLASAGAQIDRYTRELHELGLDTTEREVRWLNELIRQEQRAARAHDPGDAAGPTGNT